MRIYWSDLFVNGALWFLLPAIFARFLLGLYAGKQRLQESVAEYVPLMRRVLPWLTAVAVIGNGVNAMMNPEDSDPTRLDRRELLYGLAGMIGGVSSGRLARSQSIASGSASQYLFAPGWYISTLPHSVQRRGQRSNGRSRPGTIWSPIR